MRRKRSGRVYRIVVRSELGETYAVAFEGMEMEAKNGNTILTGKIIDQPQLYGILCRLDGVEMIAEIPNIDDPGGGDRSLPGKLTKDVFCDGQSVGLPVSRMGLEQEFFLVDLRGEPRDLADVFLWECREEARAEGLDPRCFQTESVMGLVEIPTPPSHGAEEMARHYLANLGLALGVASDSGVHKDRS